MLATKRFLIRSTFRSKKRMFTQPPKQPFEYPMDEIIKSWELKKTLDPSEKIPDFPPTNFTKAYLEKLEKEHIDEFDATATCGVICAICSVPSYFCGSLFYATFGAMVAFFYLATKANGQLVVVRKTLFTLNQKLN